MVILQDIVSLKRSRLFANNAFAFQLRVSRLIARLLAFHHKQLTSVPFTDRHRRLDGKIRSSKFRRYCLPKARHCRLLGQVTSCKSWLNQQPKVRLSRLLGKIVLSRLWSKWSPNVKCRRLPGNFTSSRLWSKWLPKVKLWRPSLALRWPKKKQIYQEIYRKFTGNLPLDSPWIHQDSQFLSGLATLGNYKKTLS